MSESGGKEAKPDEEIKTGFLRQKLSDSTDIIFHEMVLDKGEKFTAIFVDGMVNSQMVDEFILKPLVQEDVFKEAETDAEIIDLIMKGTVYHCQKKLRENISDLFDDLFSGSVAIVFDSQKKAVTFEIKGFEKRGITEPTNENILKGAKESFIEILRVNTALIRRRLPSRDLIIFQMKLGRRTNTAVSLVYVDGIANQSIVDEVKKSLQKIDIDGIVAPGVIEAHLIENKYSLFPQVLYTERTDKFCASIIEGRVGIIIDGFPLSMIVPVDINSFVQATEDYSTSIFLGTFIRILRYVSASISLFLPAIYVSITTFHQEMIPRELATAIIQNKEGVPFPSYLEVIMMLIAFEVLLEAGLRMPKSIGQAVSIVGALVVGEAAISAQILSPGVVIVIATAGITGFVIPTQDLANTVRICRLILVLSSMTSGLFGVGIASIIILYHLCDLEMLGVPYLSPIVGNEGKGMFSDTIATKSWIKTKERPSNIAPQDIVRQG